MKEDVARAIGAVEHFVHGGSMGPHHQHHGVPVSRSSTSGQDVPVAQVNILSSGRNPIQLLRRSPGDIAGGGPKTCLMP